VKRISLGFCLAVFVTNLFVAALASTTSYTNIDASTAVDSGGPAAVGWGSCMDCAGGATTGSISSSPFQTRPSIDGASRDFYLSGAPYTNALLWYKLGPNSAATHFKFDFWVFVGASAQATQALEFDAFQFAAGQQYMFGTQCDYAAGVWDVWNMSTSHWIHTKLACPSFKPNTWYHVTWNFHRSTPDKQEHYDSLTLVQYNSNGSIASNKTYTVNLAYPSAPLPAGWTENMGVQFQMDIAGKGATLQEWVDQVSLTVY
jgi:hypothetical protein